MIISSRKNRLACFGAVLFFLAFGNFIQAAPPTLPTISTNNIFNVTSTTYGASTNSANNASFIQAAITAAAAASGGGTVEIPGPGTYLSGPLTMKSKVNLQVDAGATLQMLPYGSWPGSTSFILGSSISDVEISGAGIIDGNAGFTVGTATNWWGEANGSALSSRPNFIEFSKCNRILIQNLRLQNPPTFHIMIKGNNSNITAQNLDIDTDPTSPNTDGFDIGSTNILIQNCHINVGDDNIEIGGSSGLAAYITITNCAFGHGHGVSMGSLLQAGVHDVTVINCTFTNTDYAIRMKSDADRGGVVQNLYYYNLGMTNIKYAPVLIYSYYTNYGTPTTAGITPAAAAATTIDPTNSTTPIWRNIIISNVTATAGQSGMIWSRTELPATNIVLSKLNITAAGSFDLYNIRGVQILDSQIHNGSSKTFALYNAQATFSNSVSGATTISLDGVASTNSLALYNAPATCANSSIFTATPITLAGSTLSDTTSLTLPSSTTANFLLGTNAATVAVTGSLTLNSTPLNISTNSGFSAGTYTLFSYTSGSLTGTPVLGTTPSGYTYNLTNVAAAKQLNLVITSTNGIKPTITNQPATQSFYVGQSATFTAAASGTAPLSYQWRFNTSNSPANLTNSSLTLTNLQTTNAGNYTLVVTNSYGADTSAVAVLTVVLPPKFNNVSGTNGGNFIVNGSGGLPGSNYIVLASTNVALPSAQWTRSATNHFNTAGNFTLTNTPGTNQQSYFQLQLP